MFFAAGSKSKGSCRYRSLLANDSAFCRQKKYPLPGVVAAQHLTGVWEYWNYDIENQVIRACYELRVSSCGLKK
jgi:hypothetical protein